MSGFNDFLIASSLISPLKCPVCADAVGYSLTMSLPDVDLMIFAILLSYIDLGRSCKSSIEIFMRFASILSAMRSSAISKVIYSTFLPIDKQFAAM